ncbi:putative 39S ribosomal protein L22, mitochondrial [Hypsibius exemplaris]|uniref:Large ribosomal subunit protein uL22m n=1 Tax=Hypsibius exemplaris TaxID=2072580 RepID=A0A1W0WN25_HYPEX|nr:putative 39S ribosomal protein L22, mitochondrial [Hypsibius exemplaris]
MASSILPRLLLPLRTLRRCPHSLPTGDFKCCELLSAPFSRGGSVLLTSPQLRPRGPAGANFFHTSAALTKGKTPSQALEGPRKWPAYNTIVLPPQEREEPRRAAQCFHMRTQIRYSMQNLWYSAQMIRGLSIDDALNQLEFHNKKGSAIIREVLLEAQEMALRDHNFEFKSKMWIAESVSGRGVRVKGFRKHGRGRVGHLKYNFNHYFVKLEEGDPPKQYYSTPPRGTIKEQVQKHLDQLRSRRIFEGL